MALVASDLADNLKSGLGFGAEPQSSQMSGLAQDIVDHLMAGSVSHSPGSVTGDAPPSGGPLLNGAASGGTITLSPGDLSSRFASTFGQSTPEISGMADAISNHLATGLVTFDIGTISGTCTNTPSTPGVLIGQGVNGYITGLNGPTLATAISSGIGQGGATTPELLDFSSALIDYVMNNAMVTYATGAVTATCSAGGGPIILGAASGGTIS